MALSADNQVQQQLPVLQKCMPKNRQKLLIQHLPFKFSAKSDGLKNRKSRIQLFQNFYILPCSIQQLLSFFSATIENTIYFMIIHGDPV